MHRNRLLRSLPPAELAELAPRLEPVTLTLSQSIREPGEPLGHMYFPENTMLAMMIVLRDGSTVEFASIGCDGYLGNHRFGTMPESGRVLCQIEGEAFRIGARAFGEHVERLPRLRDLISRFNHYTFNVMAQLVACNSLHTIAQRCARWLLLVRDSIGCDEFEVTQDLLSTMLGVRRSGVTMAIGRLRKSGAIRYRRGCVTIVQPKTLARRSCECYATIQEIRRSLALEPC